jgi:hypothetical protein
MKLRMPSLIEWTVLCGIAVALFLLIASPAQEVWDGSFRLSLVVTKGSDVGQAPIRFATCWSDDQVQQLLKSGAGEKHEFREADSSGEGLAYLDVPVSGRSGAWGTEGTYNHPKWLVVEYPLFDGDQESLARKAFAIPSGRGQRSMSITLP